ncbi:MAG: glycosyltransferase [Bacteroidia bacterium]|nr:glycosyltransferase [Bacteroidia bacterium]
MSGVFYILYALLLVYASVLFWLAYGFIKLKRFQAPGVTEDMGITIIICARNEEKHISLCLNTLVKQDYDAEKLQIILINDASTDNTLRQAEGILRRSGLQYSIITNAEQKGKKKSIAYAMQFAHHDVIISRDADTFTRHEKWLKTLAQFYAQHPADMVIAPVALSDNFGIMWALQAIENNILLLFAAGSAYYHKPFLCSGANLMFTKKAFEQTGAYASHLHIASGDDVLFMEELKKIPGSKISYLKHEDALVYTFPCYSLGELLRQKTRWASKFKVNNNPLNFSLAVLGFLVNLAWLFCLLYGFYKPLNNSHSLLFVVFKILIDFLLLFLASGFVKNRFLLWFSLPVACVYPLYACLVALRSVFVKPKWK